MTLTGAQLKTLEQQFAIPVRAGSTTFRARPLPIILARTHEAAAAAQRNAAGPETDRANAR